MRLLLLIAILYGAAVFETSLADVIRVGHVAPDLMALLAVIWLLLTPGRRTFLVAGAIGLAADMIAPGRVGVGTACFLLIGFALTRLRAKLDVEHLVWQVPVVSVSVTMLAAGLATGRWVSGETAIPLSTLLVRAVGVGVYTTGVSVPLLMLIGWLREPFGPAQKQVGQSHWLCCPPE